MPILAALMGFIVAGATVILGNRIGNRWLRYLALIVGVVCALGVVGFIVPDSKSGELAGQIFAGLIVAFYVVKSLFFRKKKVPS